LVYLHKTHIMSKLEELEERSKVILNDMGVLQVQLHTLNHMYAEVMGRIKVLKPNEEKV
jgi:hypothetical protein